MVLLITEQGIVFLLSNGFVERLVFYGHSLFSLELADEDLNGLFDSHPAVIDVLGSACLSLSIKV